MFIVVNHRIKYWPQEKTAIKKINCEQNCREIHVIWFILLTAEKSDYRGITCGVIGTWRPSYWPRSKILFVMNGDLQEGVHKRASQRKYARGARGKVRGFRSLFSYPRNPQINVRR